MIKHYWLAVDYVENSNLWTNQHRHIERFLEFMPNGGVRRLQRHGLKADGVYGKVDNLHIYYDGNRITGVLDDAGPVTQNGSMDFPVSCRETEFGYNGWGALVKDGSRGITDISYDRFGNPLKVSYSNGSYTENVYSAAGEKLKATHATSLNGTVTGKTTTEYRGNVIYRDGKVDMVLFPGGYATVNGTTVTFHYYTQDYLGNNRAVINGSTGAIEQTVAYYPYGAVIADLGNPRGGQPYKFGGKELITANGLHEYDFGARQYYPAVPGFTKPDPCCEITPWLSTYLFCGNDPVNAVDPTGEVVIGLDEQAQQNIIYSLSEEEAKFVRFNKDGMIDAEILNQSSSDSENMSALKNIVNSSTTYYYATASNYVSDGEVYTMYSNSRLGVVGITLIPNAPTYPSPDDDVHVYTSNKLSQLDQVENAAHELFGHAYFQELRSQGQEVNPFHDMQNIAGGLEYIEEMGDYFPSLIRTDVNYPLVNQIRTVTKQAKINFQNRIRK